MVNSAVSLMIRRRVAEVCGSLVSEGYRIKFRLSLSPSYFVKMVHARNGNELFIVGRYDKRTITLKKNGRIVKTETL